LLDLKGDRWDWVDWRQWLTEKGVKIPHSTQFITFNSLPLLIQAAVRGQGIGLGWRSMVDSMITDKTLIKLLDESVYTDRGYFVVKRANVRMAAETKTLFEWILAESSLD
jgi:LysR family glycine cleavage system transcriptional activator